VTNPPRGLGQNHSVFDINGPEFLVLGAVALFVLGPDKLPGYAAQAARMMRQLRSMADGAREQMREQLGPEFDDVDWKALDPRQYDPRRIVRDALAANDEDAGPDDPGDGVDDVEPRPEKPKSAGGPAPTQPSAYDEDAT
jgi:sec-independent protein translocase protein TatB